MDSIGTLDPYVTLQVGDRKAKTTFITNTMNPEWNDQFGFVFRSQQPENVKFELYDHDRATKDELAGSGSVSLFGAFRPDGKEKITNADLPMKRGYIRVSVTTRVIKRVIGRSHEALAGYDPDELTALFRLNVLQAKNIKSRDLLSKNDAFVVVEFGKQRFATQVRPDSNTPRWNSTCPIWLTNATNDHVVKVSVMDQDGSSKDNGDLIGSVYVKASTFQSGKDIWLPLTKHSPQNDAELAEMMSQLSFSPPSEADSKQEQIAGTRTKKSLGYINLSAEVLTRQQVEEQFYSKLVNAYDFDNSGTIEEEELVHMINSLGSKLTDAEIHDVFTAADTNSDGSLSKQELTNMLVSSRFQHKDLVRRLFAVMEDGKDSVQRVIMGGFYGAATSTDTPLDNSGAQVLLQERGSGLIVQENIPTYIKSAMRLLYRTSLGQSASSWKRVHKTLKSLTEKKGREMDHPDSVSQIPGFIATHKLKIDEIARPLNEFKTFNEFFYRELKPGARVCDMPDNDNVAVSPADARMMVFRSIDDAKRLWIKGRNFTVGNLLGGWDKDGKYAEQFNGGSLVIARLAPQDYHRWHVPVSGVMGKPFMIDGGYTTVNPIAIRRDVDVYTDNKRCICPIQTKEFGTVILVAIAATMVGSINLVTGYNQQVKKFDQHGYFAFGGSTTLVLFRPGAIAFDSDLQHNSDAQLETLVKVGNRIGEATK
jgi:phosphatidylserine decarboxylase